MHWALIVLIGFIAMGLGAAYGVAAYSWFARSIVFHVAGSASGLMMASFLIGVPMVIGALVVYLIQCINRISFGAAMTVSMMPLFLFVFIAGAYLREGFICILMALPLFLFVGAVGAAVIWLLIRIGRGAGKVLSVAVFAPFVLAHYEADAPLDMAVRKVERSVHIDASPAVVWQHISFPTHIQPRELADGIAYRMGVPYPVEGRTLQSGVGGTRHVVWQRGVVFDETFTAWEPERRVAWKYVFHQDSFPPGSLDDHIVIGGRYFDLEDTSYSLTPEQGGTRLDIEVTYRVSTHFNWYALPWARFLIGDTAEALLRFYKHRAEQV